MGVRRAWPLFLQQSYLPFIRSGFAKWEGDPETVISKAYIEQFQPNVPDEEGDALVSVFAAQGIPTERFTPKKIRRRWLDITKETLVAGSVTSVRSALKQISPDLVPTPNDYPKSLRSFLHRRIWRTTLGEVIRSSESAEFVGGFVKPSGVDKRFTGRRIQSLSDLQFLRSFSLSTEIYQSEIVEWVQEWRCFVLDGEILGVRQYRGVGNQAPTDLSREMIAAFMASDEGKRAFALDVGELTCGQWALVEVNDAYALGRYSLEATSYTELIVAAWRELVGSL